MQATGGTKGGPWTGPRCVCAPQGSPACCCSSRVLCRRWGCLCVLQETPLSQAEPHLSPHRYGPPWLVPSSAARPLTHASPSLVQRTHRLYWQRGHVRGVCGRGRRPHVAPRSPTPTLSRYHSRRQACTARGSHHRCHQHCRCRCRRCGGGCAAAGRGCTVRVPGGAGGAEHRFRRRRGHAGDTALPVPMLPLSRLCFFQAPARAPTHAPVQPRSDRPLSITCTLCAAPGVQRLPAHGHPPRRVRGPFPRPRRRGRRGVPGGGRGVRG